MEDLGRRIAALRKMHGLTQLTLATRVGVSVSLVKKVEAGIVPPSHGFLQAVATTLGLGVLELTGEHVDVLETEAHPSLSSVRALLFGVTDPGHDPRPLSELLAEVQRLWKLNKEGKFAAHLPDATEVLRELHTYDEPTAYKAAAQMYGQVHFALHCMGSQDLAAAAINAEHTAALRSDDPLELATCHCRRGLLLMTEGQYDAGLGYLARAFQAAQDSKSEHATTVRGALHLRSAILSARKGSRDQAEEHIAEARALLPYVPRTDPYGLQVVPVNVEYHWVACAVEVGDGGLGLERARHVRAHDQVTGERRAHYWLDVAHGCVLHGRRSQQALEALRLAREAAPELTRRHWKAASAVRTLAEQERRRNAGLAAFAMWMGIR
ncbi:Helix-turn-helix domain-containing protein [Streptoalloteichus tenebrarius]|uniref:Helix-turn-helix domain-containing protein n=1 Tax=Streptoalloteichus tenebrarius (strain ATCC 17920 / DSM 40477 / JCM 4838 / CBS 697.72 / NBRC 16177 / NCIMB 11028 / NRRL B-12390 / A12253. 1 / ISP 5477) TaxID=1933 RepID=A0ABT1I4Y4_STRSD|nr:helix-turn-helix transcriptional regulator [Streptoalloteichus tenebrarius]MCP2262655.1 Helix-turn-helix domain-containing protein [Streptoalloteichus tenebrarius]BFF01848.1 hypothetical protein GCM10020241_35230 [Streptoalloteichus tenebrarius]